MTVRPPSPWDHSVPGRTAPWVRWILALLVVCGALNARAQDDPPGRVARVALVQGQVWLYSPDSGDWIDAELNRPLTSGDRIATDPGARAELEVGSTTLRLDGGTELEVLQLDDQVIALQEHNGSVAVVVRDFGSVGDFELTTVEGRFLIQRAGSYRFDRSDVKSTATVYAGLARYEGPNSGLSIYAGQRAEFWIDSGGVAQYSLGAPLNDDFAAWSRDRDRQVSTSVAARYVSPEMTGAEDLDRYGRWERSPDYGVLWIPTVVAVDWVPYRHGHWVWISPWGWTWVDDAPWGFAPFHYGRWVHVRDRWCWTPGVRVHRPVYAPALVAWVGAPRVGVSVTIGGGPAVGWFPLAPREVYVPSHHASLRYAREVNITNVTNVTQINSVIENPKRAREFQNRRIAQAVTVVPAGVVAGRRPVAPAAATAAQTPWVRDLARQPGLAPTLIAPPISAPPPARRSDGLGVRPPPGAAERAAPSALAPMPARERSGAERRSSSRDRFEPPLPDGRAAAPGRTPGSPVVPTPIDPSRPSTQRRGETHEAPRWPDQRAMPVNRGSAPATQAAPTAATPMMPARPPAPAARAVEAPSAARPPEAPTMRPLPVRRGEARRDEVSGADGRRAAPAGHTPAPAVASPAEVRAPQRVDRPPSPSTPRAEPVQPPTRPVAAPQPARPVVEPARQSRPSHDTPRAEPQRGRPEGPANESPRPDPRAPPR